MENTRPPAEVRRALTGDVLRGLGKAVTTVSMGAGNGKDLRDLRSALEGFNRENPVPREFMPPHELLDARLYRRVEGLGLSTRLRHCLAAAKIDLIRELVLQRPEDLLKINGFGKRLLKEVERLLAYEGLRLCMMEEELNDP